MFIYECIFDLLRFLTMVRAEVSFALLIWFERKRRFRLDMFGVYLASAG